MFIKIGITNSFKVLHISKNSGSHVVYFNNIFITSSERGLFHYGSCFNLWIVTRHFPASIERYFTLLHNKTSCKMILVKNSWYLPNNNNALLTKLVNNVVVVGLLLLVNKHLARISLIRQWQRCEINYHMWKFYWMD